MRGKATNSRCRLLMDALCLTVLHRKQRPLEIRPTASRNGETARIQLPPGFNESSHFHLLVKEQISEIRRKIVSRLKGSMDQ